MILWIHYLSLEAMFQDEMGEIVRKNVSNLSAAAPSSPLADESWWRMRWLQEARRA